MYVTPAESCLLPGYRAEESGGGGDGAKEGGTALQSHDLIRRTDGRTEIVEVRSSVVRVVSWISLVVSGTVNKLLILLIQLLS